MKKVCHLTSVHSRYDTRIFIKECRTLSTAGYDVYLVVADGLPDEEKEGVSIIGVQKESNRFKRILRTPPVIYKKALELDADVYHLHDPELIPIGKKLKRKGKIVVFDSHEDVSAQILNKPYMKRFFARCISYIYSKYERSSLRVFDLIIAATPYIQHKISKWHKQVVNINNYPLLDELFDSNTSNKEKFNEIVYVGGITSIRGIKELVHSLEFVTTDVKLNLVGNFSEPEVEKEVKKYKGWSKVNELGFLYREHVKDVLSRSKIGILTFYPIKNHIDAQPNKMFEYMSAGLPVIASNFPLWKNIIEGNNCGICVDPYNYREIAKAIDYLINNEEIAKNMRRNGRKAVEEKYNWTIEETKLIDAYRKI